jgi:hypothetical protein
MARKQQQRNCDSCKVRADSCASNKDTVTKEWFSVRSALMAAHATKAQQQKNGVFCAIHAVML